MRTKTLLTAVLCIATLGNLGTARAQGISAGQLADHGLASGSPREILPSSGALLHLQIHDLLSVVEGVEEILVAGIPEKALPPDMQQLMQTEHPLLTLLGMQTLQQPITPEVVAQVTGLDVRRTIGLTLYFGDPRRMFVLSLPTQAREPLAGLLNGLLKPSQVEEVRFGEKKALRVVSQSMAFLPELYLVSSDDMLYLCGDRSLAQALHHTPASQRFDQDPFLSRVLPGTEDKQLRLVLNPSLMKPFAMQLQGLGTFAKMMIPPQRAKLLAQVPTEAREQIEMQLRSQLHVRDLEEFADYAECVLIATLEGVLDFVTSRMVAFEGLTIDAALGGGEIEFTLRAHSQRFQPEAYTSALPMGEVKETLAWLGPKFQSFTATGKKPTRKENQAFSAWLERVRVQCDARGLKSSFLVRLSKLLEEQSPIPTVESQVPWTLTTRAPLNPAPSLKDAASLQDYFATLEGPVYRPITIVPDQGRAFLETCFRGEVEALNHNRELGLAFAETFQKQRPWVRQVSRFHSTALNQGITRYVRESAWITQGGIFGYDQHELVNRKVVHARRVDDYLIYHRGAKPSLWLATAQANRSATIALGTARLLESVPEGANYVSVCRLLVSLPGCVDWLAELEERVHTDGQAYLRQAQALVDASDDPAAAKNALLGLPMPVLMASVNVDPETKRVYALLPAGPAAFVFPRPRVIPLVQELLKDYAAQADDVGGSAVYTKVGSETWEYSVRQSTAALTTLTKTVGNALFENYMGSPDWQQRLQQKVGAARDWDDTVFNEVVIRNPRWASMPQPKPKTPAKPSQPIPSRAPGTDVRLLDLSDHYNAALTETWHRGGMSNNTLKDLPRGVHAFDEISFDVRGIVQLSGRGALQELDVEFPKKVTGIAAGLQADTLHFLHGCGWAAPNGTAIGKYVIHYANGQMRTIPIIYGTHLQDWWADSAGTTLDVAWSGPNHSASDGSNISIYQMAWPNPLPSLEIASIDYQSEVEEPAPFLIAITAE